MICKRCDSLIPDDASQCPACGRPFNRAIKRKNPLATVIRLSDCLVLLMTVLNGVLALTASHFTLSTENGIFYEKMVMYYYFPILEWTDFASEIALLIALGLSAVAHFWLRRERRAGLVLIIALHAFNLLWAVGYPVFVYLLTGIVTPILGFTMVQATVYFGCAAFSSLYLIRSNAFLY